MDKKKKKSKTITKGMLTFSLAMFAICFMFFNNIISVSAKTTKQKEVTTEEYTLILQERDGIKEKINGVDIGLKYSSENPRVATYDETLLKATIDKLACFDISKITESIDAKIIYENGSYVISKEVYGNKVKKDTLYNNVIKAIQNGETTINLQGTNCYEVPIIVANSPEIVNAKETLNKYLASNITYNYAGITQVLDSSIIKDWIIIDSNFGVTLDENFVRKYVYNLASNYDKSLGTTIPVNGGYDGNNHSWIINTDEETKALIENIKSGQTITKHPIYTQTSEASYFSNVGSTYVEIDMTKQHLWFYKNGYLVVEGDVVTGNVSNGAATPTGVYKLYFKQKDAILRGEGYESPVNFWMPFNNGIGLHDASWRSVFGGEIYKNDGSHGCINAPYYVAQTVYDNIRDNDYFICHY